ncbi:MAG: ferritin family protein [Candidatus Aureabacteria bacterium]|nr:ferritin family protein [Candidatus Auribacterota bacterium]
MEKVFSPQEILKIAIDVENNGITLYSSLAEKATDDKLKKMWTFLKEEEVKHAKFFQEMLDNAGDYIEDAFGNDEYEKYILAVASQYIFIKELMDEKISIGFKSDLEAVQFGIDVEKETILTYSAFKEYVKDSRKTVLDKVIDEEKKHFIALVSLKKSLIADLNE